ncbi:MAG TPA: hypothetical protein VE860_13200 [Chthoniobacterales bacterium]|nr:hypothetical protein [Chthoniobacterales bacterium]
MALSRATTGLMTLAFAVVLTFAVNTSARADDDTWHNVYHSLKRFFTGSKSSPTPSIHYHVKHNGGSEKGAEPSSSISSTPEKLANASPSPAASSTPRVVVLPSATPDAVVLPAATPLREASSAATPSEAPAATPSPAPRPVGQLVPGAANSTSKSESPAQSGPVLRSLSGPGAAASPASQPTATP